MELVGLVIVIFLVDIFVYSGFLNFFAAALFAGEFVRSVHLQDWKMAAVQTVLGLFNCYVYFLRRGDENPSPQ